MQKFLLHLHLFILGYFSSFVLVECGPFPPWRDKCTDIKREWKHDGSTDCGQCLEGYTDDNTGKDSPCKTSSVINVNESRIAFVHKNATVILECIFNQPISDCVWERRGYDVEISGRYHWRHQGGAGKIDCSISITGFKEFDVGEWKCSSAATSNSYSIPNINPYLHMTKEDIVTVDHDSAASLPVGESVILKCYFEQEVDCVWLHNVIIVEFGGRLKYVGDDNYLRNSKDCSIQIDNITDIDFGRWDCKSMAYGSTYAMLKSAVWLSKVDRPVARELTTESDYKTADNELKNENSELTSGEWKSITCYGNSVKDCGQCLEECYAEGIGSKFRCMPLGNPITVEPKEGAIVPNGVSAILKCHFDQEVICGWQRDEHSINITGRYKYVTWKNNGKATKDCSIQIKHLKDEDFGPWFSKATLPPSRVKKSVDHKTDPGLGESAPKVTEHAFMIKGVKHSTILHSGSGVVFHISFVGAIFMALTSAMCGIQLLN